MIYIHTSPFKAATIKNDCVYDVKYITAYTNFYTTRSQMARIT